MVHNYVVNVSSENILMGRSTMNNLLVDSENHVYVVGQFAPPRWRKLTNLDSNGNLRLTGGAN